METASYVPGTWLGVVRSRTAVLLGPGTPPALVSALWDLLADRPEAHEVLHAVTSSFGVSLARIPPFGILDFDGSLRVFLRGDLDLTVLLPGGPVELSGRDVTTWTERRLDSPDSCRVDITAAAGTVSGSITPGGELPLGEGVVLLQSLALALAPAQVALGPVSPVASISPAASAAPPATATEPTFQTRPDEQGVSAETVIGVLDDDTTDDQDGDITDDDHDGATIDDPDDHDAGTNAGTWAEPTPEPMVEEAVPEAVGPATELTGSYDHLWERTVIRRIEDAAVREDPNDEDHPAAAALEAPVVELPPDEVPVADVSVPEVSTPEVSTPDVPAPVPAGEAARPAKAGVLIDSVPWRTGTAASAVASAGPAGQQPLRQREPEQETRPPEPPAEQIQPSPGPNGSGAGFEGDHDGQTVMKSSLAGMAAQQPAPAVLDDPSSAPLVLARVCPQGHANPPTSSQCAACGVPLATDAVQVHRPRLGRMRVSTGELIDLDQSLVVGRQPSVSRVQGGEMPRLVQVASPGGDISRSHVEVRLEGWHVMLCDLKATNGTVLVREGQPPRRLAQNEMAILLDGDIAELGDNVFLRFEEIL